MSDSKAKRPEPRAAAVPTPPIPAASAPAAAPASAPVDTTIPDIVARRSKAVGEESLAYGQKALTAIAESQAAMARGLEALALEVSGLTRAAVVAASDGTTALLGAKTVADAVEAQIGLTRWSLEAAVSGSAKLNELCLKLASDVSRPLMAGFEARGATAGPV